MVRVMEELPGSPVVKALCFHCKGHRFGTPSPAPQKRVMDKCCIDSFSCPVISPRFKSWSATSSQQSLPLPVFRCLVGDSCLSLWLIYHRESGLLGESKLKVSLQFCRSSSWKCSSAQGWAYLRKRDEHQMFLGVTLLDRMWLSEVCPKHCYPRIVLGTTCIRMAACLKT